MVRKMSKSEKKRDEYLQKRREKEEREAFEAKKNKVRSITAIVASSLLGIFVVGVLVGTIIANARANSGSYLRSKTAASSKNIDVNGAVMSYYFNDVYNTFLNYYGSYVSYYGLNTNLSLKNQKMSDNQTWFDYFMSGAKTNVSGILALNEAAKADNVSLDEGEINALTIRADNADTGLYGQGVKRGDIYDARTLEALAYKYQFMKQDELTPTDAEIDAEYNSNPKKYQSVGYYSYEFSWSEDPEDENAVTKESAKAEADALASHTGINGFKTAIRQLLKTGSDEESGEALDSKVEAQKTTGALYTEGNEISEWLFGEAAVGDTKVFEDDSAKKFTVCVLCDEPTRDESRTINVRHILFSFSDDESEKKAKKAAEKVLAEFNSGDKSIESFADLALAYSDDSGSLYNGGLYENVVEGRMVTAFNDWCFSEERKPGDADLITTDYGYHIMYFVGDGMDVWQASVADTILSERFSELNEKLTSDYPVAFDDTVLNSIPA